LFKNNDNKHLFFMLQDLFQWYLDNQNEIVQKYNGKYIVIKSNAIVGSYNSDIEAILESEKKYELGTFLVQRCSPGTEAYTQNFSSRIIFA